MNSPLSFWFFAIISSFFIGVGLTLGAWAACHWLDWSPVTMTVNNYGGVSGYIQKEPKL